MVKIVERKAKGEGMRECLIDIVGIGTSRCLCRCRRKNVGGMKETWVECQAMDSEAEASLRKAYHGDTAAYRIRSMDNNESLATFQGFIEKISGRDALITLSGAPDFLHPGF